MNNYIDPIIILAQGRSASRLACKIMVENGVNMGNDRIHPDTCDLHPPEPMYQAAAIVNQWRMGQVTQGDMEWNVFEEYVMRFIEDIPTDKPWGWKLPETAMAFPWLREMFPRAKYIWWTRDPRDVIRGFRVTDNFEHFHIPNPNRYEPHSFSARAWNYKWQHDAVAHYRPKKADILHVRFEDVVGQTQRSIGRITKFCNMSLTIPPKWLDAKRVQAWRREDDEGDPHDLLEAHRILKPCLEELGYA